MCFSFLFLVMFVFFFKQKTAYEMRISDWSSDVCSSDLVGNRIGAGDEIATLQLPVEYAVQPVGFLDVAIDRIGDRLGRVAVEMVVLPRHRAQPAHLPHQPLHRIDLLARGRSEEHTSELQSLMRISYAVFCCKQKNTPHKQHAIHKSKN